MDGKLLNAIKSTCVHSLACVKVKEGESERFRIDGGRKNRSASCPLVSSMYIWTQ